MKSLAGWIACALGACDHSPPPAPPPADSNATFVAFPATFADFRAWTSVHDDGPPDDGTYGSDVLGPRTQYINQVPPHGATQFPIGTVIVEARESGQMLIIAAAKRGGDFNADGAVSWEWFGLAEGSDGSVGINWRGIGPPVGGYGALPTSGCNECHQACGANNDFVCSPELQLASF